MLCRDITELRDRERELVTKDATIREIHHRVKNNLQTVAALLRLQARRTHSDEAKNALTDATNRVQSIAVVHEILSQSYDEEAEFDQVADKLLQMVGDVAAASGTVRAKREGSFGLVPAKVATSLSLILTELCQNAIEHGLATHSGNVFVRPQRNAAGDLVLDVVDEGEGLPEGFQMGATNSLGTSIVTTLVADLGRVHPVQQCRRSGSHLTHRGAGVDAQRLSQQRQLAGPARRWRRQAEGRARRLRGHDLSVSAGCSGATT